MDNGEQCGFIDIISILSFIIGLENLDLNQQQLDGVMKELQENQNTMLSKIIQQNEEIIKLDNQIINLLKEQ